MRSLTADEAETGADPARRRKIERRGVDAPLAGDDQFDRPALPFEPESPFDAASPLCIAIPAAVDADDPDAARGNHADTRVHGNPQIGARVRFPGVVDTRLQEDAEQVAVRTNAQGPPPNVALDGDAEHVPIHRYDLEPIAKMSRRVMQQRGNLVSMRARRCRQVEEIVSLVGIEPAEFLAEDRLVVGGERRSPDSVVDKIHLAAEVGVQDEPRIVLREVLGAEVEIVAREKLDRALGGNGRGARDHRERAERATNHSEPLSALSSASFASSSLMRLFSSGRRRKTAAARRHSRASIAG